MKKKIIVTHTVECEIEVELPHYYKQDLNPDQGSSVIYGVIYPDKTFTIQINNGCFHGEMEVEFMTEKTNLKSFAAYFTDENYRSYEREFLQARGQAAKFCNEFFKLG